MSALPFLRLELGVSILHIFPSAAPRPEYAIDTWYSISIVVLV